MGPTEPFEWFNVGYVRKTMAINAATETTRLNLPAFAQDALGRYAFCSESLKR